jgi:hypothetical protein
MGYASVLITEHRYTPKYDRTEIAGKYCVQFMTFKKDDRGLKVLNWWMNACLDWCYDRYEDGKFGDQKYLDTWTEQFEGVHVLKHLGGGMAPWNIQQYQFIDEKENGDKIFQEITSGTNFVAIFYHYHYVRFYKNQLVDLGWFSLTKSTIQRLYSDYVKQLELALQQIQKIDSGFKENLRPFSIRDTAGFKGKIKVIVKFVTRLNLFKTSDFN